MNVRSKRIFFCVVVILLSVFYLFMRKSSNEHAKKENVIFLKFLLAAAVRAAELGGYEVVAVHDQIEFNIESKGKTKEGVNDPVTAADYRSHCVMYHSLRKTFPEIAVISEETSKDCNKADVPDLKSYIELGEYDIGEDVEDMKDVTIWIDPLDATKEFTENLLQYVTTMVCVAVKGKPVIGVIYKPFESRKDHNLYWTWTNHGVSSNLREIAKQENEKAPILIVSRSHAGQVNNVSKNAFGENVRIVSAAGAGYKFLEVAIGNATAYLHTTTIKKWDICAGTAIVSALGGTVTSLFQRQPIYFDSTDSKVVTSGLLTTMTKHDWYLDKFLNV